MSKPKKIIKESITTEEILERIRDLNQEAEVLQFKLHETLDKIKAFKFILKTLGEPEDNV